MQTNRIFTVVEGGETQSEYMKRRVETTQEFMSFFPKAQLDYFTFKEIEEIVETCRGLTKQGVIDYIEGKMQQVMIRLHDEAAINYQKYRGLL